MYGEQINKSKIFAMTPEVGRADDGFWPASDRIIPLSQENMYANLTLARLAGHYGTISHNQRLYVSQLSNEFIYSFKQLGLDTIGNFTISITPLTSNIIFTGTSHVYSNLNSFQILVDSISFSLSPTILPGEEISFTVNVNNGLFIEADTITQIYGNPVVIFSDDCTDLVNWNTVITSWGITTEDYVSPPSSITDSPFNFYIPNDDNSLSLETPINLSGLIDARLTFYAKWDTEGQYDFVQVLASADNGITWTALCGKFTVTGSPSEAPGEPVYDGKQTSWVAEEMNLNNFLGQSVLLKIALKSDPFQERDGFYFDDLKVEAIPDNTGISQFYPSLYLSSPSPNPASLQALVNYSNSKSGSVFTVYNTYGQIIWKKKLNDTSGKILIPVNEFSSGTYFYQIKHSNGLTSSVKKLMVRK